jgi:SAM-dependent methyltransferase
MELPRSMSVGLNDPSIPRVYDYMLGGRDNFPADRELAGKLLQAAPDLGEACRNNRVFLQRAVRFMAEDGIDQFIDLGAGIPTSPNVHEVARAVVPGARVVYVDSDPIVITHGQALLGGADGVGIIEGDMLDVQDILDHAKLNELIDWSRPVGVLFVAVLHFVTDAEDALATVGSVMDRAAPGSLLAISHVSNDQRPKQARAIERLYHRSLPGKTRNRSEIEALFHGMPLLLPGLTHAADWRPDHLVTATERAWTWAGVARKP